MYRNTYIIGNMRTCVEDMNQEQVATVTPLNQQQFGRSTEYTLHLFTWYFPGSLDVSLKLFEKLVTTFIQVLIGFYFAFKDSVT